MTVPYIKGMHYCDIFYNNCWAELIFTMATSNFKLPNRDDDFKLSMRIIEGEGCKMQDTGCGVQGAACSSGPFCHPT